MHGGRHHRGSMLINMLQEDDCDAVVCIISHDLMWRMADTLSSIEWDLIVGDETHNMKSDRTRRWGGLKKLRDVAKSRLALTGTPIVNGVHDLYTQLEFLGEGYSGFSTFEAFKKYHCRIIEVSDTVKLFAGAKNVPLLQERLARMSFMISKEEALPELPPRIYDTVDVEMTPEQTAVYKMVAAQIRAEIEDELDESKNRTVTVNNVLVKMLRLAQITSGFVVTDAICDFETGTILEPSNVDRFDPNPKLDALIECLKEREPHQKVIIWASWRQDIKSIAARLMQEGIEFVEHWGETSEWDREYNKKIFNETTIPVFLANQATSREGVDLRGVNPSHEMRCDWMIYYSQRWPPVERWQSEARNEGPGTTYQRRVTDLCVPDSIDEAIRIRVLEKKLNAMKTLDVRALLNEVTKCLEYLD